MIRRFRYFIQDYWLPLLVGAAIGFIAGLMAGIYLPGFFAYLVRAVIAALD